MLLLGCRELINIGGGFVEIARWMKDHVARWCLAEIKQELNIFLLKNDENLSRRSLAWTWTPCTVDSLPSDI